MQGAPAYSPSHPPDKARGWGYRPAKRCRCANRRAGKGPERRPDPSPRRERERDRARGRGEIDTEWSSGRVWNRSVRISSAVTAAPIGATAAGTMGAWIYLGQAARQLGGTETAGSPSGRPSLIRRWQRRVSPTRPRRQPQRAELERGRVGHKQMLRPARGHGQAPGT